MKIYHFCAWRHLASIQRAGLVIGGVFEPLPGGGRTHWGWCWLTLDGDPARQSWNTHHLIHYNRAAWRLTIDIPDNAIHALYDRNKLVAIYPTCGQLFDGWPGSENWRVFRGTIPPEWIVAADKM